MEWGLSPFDGSYSTGVVYCAMSFLLRELQYVMFVLTNKTFVYLEKHGLCTVCLVSCFSCFFSANHRPHRSPLKSQSQDTRRTEKHDSDADLKGEFSAGCRLNSGAD